MLSPTVIEEATRTVGATVSGGVKGLELLEQTTVGPFQLGILYHPGRHRIVHIFGMPGPRHGFQLANELSPILRAGVDITYMPGYASWAIVIPERMGSFALNSVLETLQRLGKKNTPAETLPDQDQNPLGVGDPPDA